ncbi:MAG: hypothetical protein AB8B96_07780 [Lysobacterales bacterium]
MSWVEQTLRDTFRQSLEASSGANTLGSQQKDECPSSERVWDAVSLILNADERRNIVDHTSRCANCAMVWQAALSVQREVQANESPSISTTAIAPTSWWQKLLKPAIAGPALAASAALAVALVWVNEPAELDPLAPPVASGVLRGASDAGPELIDHEDQLGAGDTLNWKPVNDAIGYEVVLTNGTGLTSKTVVESPPYTIDSAIISAFFSGDELGWTVTTVGGADDGNRSKIQRFILR